jgi:hypothetical protein
VTARAAAVRLATVAAAAVLLAGCGGSSTPDTLPAATAGHITTVSIPAGSTPHATVAVGEPIAVQVSAPHGHAVYFSVSPTGTAKLEPRQREPLEQTYVAKAPGTAVVEVVQAPVCEASCSDQRTVIGKAQVTVTK